MYYMDSILVVGAGLSGAVIARRLADKYNVTVIDKRNHIGGNCYDHYDDGILMNKYGAHIFHTNNERVWNFVNQYSKWVPWEHKVLGRIDDKYFPIPVNVKTAQILLNKTFTQENMKEFLAENQIIFDKPRNGEEVAIKNVGTRLYELIFKQYTFKQWNKYPSELDASVLARIPVRDNYNDNYFNDKYQALPAEGYTAFISNILNHPNITVKLETSFTKDMVSNNKMVFFTGPIDHYYSHLNLPKLEYRSINFVKEYLDIDYYQSNSVINYPQNEIIVNGKKIDTPWTRIIEYKHFNNQRVPNKTVIVKEYTCDGGEPYYPVPTQKNQDIYKKYQEEALKDESSGLYFLGRLGNYKYLNMDQAIEQALILSDRFA